MGPAIVRAVGIIQKAGSSPKAQAQYRATLKYVKELKEKRVPEWANRNLLKDPRFIKDPKNPNKLIRQARKIVKEKHG